jgi:hypothetical protein
MSSSASCFGITRFLTSAEKFMFKGMLSITWSPPSALR